MNTQEVQIPEIESDEEVGADVTHSLVSWIEAVDALN